MNALVLMKSLKNKIIDSRHYDTSDLFTLENKNNAHADRAINDGSSAFRILIIEDDPDIALSFSIGLEDGGFEVYTYNDSLDAFLNFKPSFYDLLLIDINMPKMNALSFVPKY